MHACLICNVNNNYSITDYIIYRIIFCSITDCIALMLSLHMYIQNCCDVRSSNVYNISVLEMCRS